MNGKGKGRSWKRLILAKAILEMGSKNAKKD